jgi:hypothetical protein
MARYKSIVLTNPKEGRDADFNKFYDEQHLGDVLSVPGFVSAERFKLAHGDGRWSYMTLYEIETDDVPAMMKETHRRIQSGEMPIGDASDLSQLYTAVFAPTKK